MSRHTQLRCSLSIGAVLLLSACQVGGKSAADKNHELQVACLAGGRVWDSTSNVCGGLAPLAPTATPRRTKAPTPRPLTQKELSLKANRMAWATLFIEWSEGEDGNRAEGLGIAEYYSGWRVFSEVRDLTARIQEYVRERQSVGPLHSFPGRGEVPAELKRELDREGRAVQNEGDALIEAWRNDPDIPLRESDFDYAVCLYQTHDIDGKPLDEYPAWCTYDEDYANWAKRVMIKDLWGKYIYLYGPSTDGTYKRP